MAAYFEHNRGRWREQQLQPAADLDWLEDHIARSVGAARQRAVARHRRWLDLFMEKVKNDAYTPVYAVQSMVSEWIGDIRIVERPRLIGPELIEEVRPRLRPGDILLERRTWCASNAFLPGFWPHAALYVGGIEDLERLGIADRPEVRSRLDQFLAQDADGHSHTVIEALAEGVIFSTLEHTLDADYAAVLRPRLSDQELAEAVANAFRHHGKPYDFEFDFFTSDKLVCTELVYRSFSGLVDFELEHVMGRDTLPALAIARKFINERTSPERELDLVLFIDADPIRGVAFFADEQAFVAAADRMREFNEEGGLGALASPLALPEIGIRD